MKAATTAAAATVTATVQRTSWMQFYVKHKWKYVASLGWILVTVLSLFAAQFVLPSASRFNFQGVVPTSAASAAAACSLAFKMIAWHKIVPWRKYAFILQFHFYFWGPIIKLNRIYLASDWSMAWVELRVGFLVLAVLSKLKRFWQRSSPEPIR